ncbi:alpha/beta hydrolase-fold protein [Algibacter mikhailovii]|uniref:alpha/beta hydrolase-fold protein n=1 Tax=Algibacter mikhailovii TaxID=425498 RepID=UPI0024953E32|nr:alpha/beta hydrolase-fold protein [Algibacter mikhailovii]
MKSYSNRLLIMFLILTSWAFAQVPVISKGTIVHLKNVASKYVDSRNVDIWLPSNYSTNKKYSVLYMQDGMSLFDASITWNNRIWKVNKTL